MPVMLISYSDEVVNLENFIVSSLSCRETLNLYMLVYFANLFTKYILKTLKLYFIACVR